MSFIENIFKRVKPITVNDDFFGKLVFQKMPDVSKSYWEGKKIFKTTNRPVELIIESDSPEKLPNASQIAFYQEIESSYWQLTSSLSGMVMAEFEKFSDLPENIAFEKHFTVSLISIPRSPAPDTIWEISFESDYDGNHIYTVIMDGTNPQSIQIDG